MREDAFKQTGLGIFFFFLNKNKKKYLIYHEGMKMKTERCLIVFLFMDHK